MSEYAGIGSIANGSWYNHLGFTPLTPESLRASMELMHKLIDEDLAVPRPSYEFVHPREYEYRAYENPGATKLDWWNWCRAWHRVMPQEVPSGE